MKKISLIISIILLMFLGGCLGKKTEQQLNEVPGNTGGTPEIKADYKYLNDINSITNSSNLTDSLKGDFYSFKVMKSGLYNDAIDVIFGSKGQFSSKTISDKSGFPIVKVTASADTVDLVAEQMGMLKENNIEITGAPVIIGNGTIQCTIEKVTGKYRGIDTLAKDGTKLTVLSATIIKTIKTDNSSKDKILSYVVSTIIKGKSASDVLLFETVLSNLEMKEQVLTEDTTAIGQIEKEGTEKFDALRNASGADTITTKLNAIYSYIEKYYAKELGITSLTTTEEKQIKILEKATTLKQNFDDILKKKILEVNVEWEKKLETQAAYFEQALDSVRPTSIENPDKSLTWTFNYTYQGGALETEANKTEEILNSFIKARRDKNILNKTESSEYYIMYEEMVASLGSFEQLFSDSVKNLVIAYTIELISDYSSPFSSAKVDKQGEGKYKQFQKILKWKNVLVRTKSDIYKVYQDGVDGNIAREYVDKKGINSLYLRLNEDIDFDYFKLKSGEDAVKFGLMKKEFADILRDDTKNSAYNMLLDYADYFNIRAGRFENRYSEKGDSDANTMEPTQTNTNFLVYGFDGVQEAFETYLYMIKMFDNQLISNLSISTEQIDIDNNDLNNTATTYYKLMNGSVSILDGGKEVGNSLNKKLGTRYRNTIDNFKSLSK